MKDVIVASSVIEEKTQEIIKSPSVLVVRFMGLNKDISLDTIEMLRELTNQKNYTCDVINLTEGFGDRFAHNGSGVGTLGLMGYLACSEYIHSMTGDITASMGTVALSLAFIAQNTFHGYSKRALEVIPGLDAESFRKQTKSMWRSSIPLVGRLFRSTYLFEMSDGSVYIIDTKGKCSIEKYTPRPKEAIALWDNLFELETGESVEDSKKPSTD